MVHKPLAELRPLKVTVAPTGARRTKADHPKLPVTIDEIADCAARSQLAGAHEIHLHVRDRKGGHTIDPGLYREAIAAVSSAAPGMSVQVTTEAAGRFDVNDQYQTLTELAPSAASVSIREMQRDPVTAARLYAFAADQGTRLQHILYDHHDLEGLRTWLDEGVIAEPMRDVLLVLGRYSPALDARVDELHPFLAALGQDFPDWTVCAFGKSEHAVAMAAVEAGGDVRIGFENNIHRPDGSLSEDNAENIARTIASARAMGRSVADQRKVS